MQGYANIAFAGGRDTIINTVSTIFGYLGEHPEALAAIRENPKTVITATEELIRFA
jgi:cytochrome P450